jgi:4'-phosphopantetheinyl transferase
MPTPSDNRVTIWRLDLREGGALPLEGLDPEELQRGARLQDRGEARRWLAAHGAMRAILGRELGLAPGQVQFSREAGGKPRLAPGPGQLERHFSLTHSGDWAWLVLAPFPVGIDLEQVRPDLDWRALAEAIGTPSERRWVLAGPEAERSVRCQRLWVRKEALLKAAGLGLGSGPSLQGVDALQASCCLEPSGTWWVQELPAPLGYAGALATPVEQIVLKWVEIPSS